MRRRVGSIAFGVCLLLLGCVPSEDAQTLVSNPFGQPPNVQLNKPSYTPAEKEVALRVGSVGKKIVEANPQLALQPMFITIGSPEQFELFHKGLKEIYITEGLVNKCANEGQLAALLCNELGKMVAEREVLTPNATRQPDREPPPNVPIGNESSVLGAADGTHLVELAKFERDRIPRDVTVPPPSPDILARRCLQKAGYTLDDLDAAAPLLRQSEANGAWRKQLVGNGF
jgi:hypothetical protein